MNHAEAVREMAAERYLLNELTPEVRDAFEEHMFDCPQCALDVRAGAAFVDEARAQLPQIVAGSPVAKNPVAAREQGRQWFAWLRPAFAVPVMAALLIVVGYQNLVTLPALHKSATQPHIVPLAQLYGATRGVTRILISADRAYGIALPVDLSPEPSVGNYATFSFELGDPQGKLTWEGSVPASAQTSSGDLQLSVVVPGGVLENGTYTMAVYGITANGQRTMVARYVFDVALSK